MVRYIREDIIMKEVVSIIMPAYNAEKTIKQSIESVLRQSFANFKLYIINDASQDGTEKIVKEYTDPRIFYIKNEYNLGVANSRNKGIELCKGNYISFLDSDDIWYEHKLERQIHYLSTGADIVCSYYETFLDSADNIINLRHSPERITYSKMLKSNYIGNLTGIYNADKLGKVYQRDIGHEDYVMWLELMKYSTECYCIKETLAKYRLSNSSLSGNKFRAVLWQWQIYREVLSFNFIKSLYYFNHYIVNGLSKRQ